MEALNKKNQERVNRVDNRVAFSNGDERRPEYAILLPNGHSVLCRAGANLGITALISRREADKKGICYLYPSEWKEYSLGTGVFVYPNNEVRDAKGKFLGQYLGMAYDKYSPYPLWGAHKIFFQKDKAIYSLDVEGNLQQTTAEEVVSSRIGWDTSKKIIGSEEPTLEELTAEIELLAKHQPELLKAALLLQEIRQFNPPTPEELERRAQQKRSRRCQTLAYDYLLQLTDNCPIAEDCESLWCRLSEMTDEQLDRFERGEMSKEELNWAPKEGWSAFVDTPLVGVGEGTSLFPNPKKRKIRRQRTAEEEAAAIAAARAAFAEDEPEETPEAPAE